MGEIDDKGEETSLRGEHRTSWSNLRGFYCSYHYRANFPPKISLLHKPMAMPRHSRGTDLLKEALREINSEGLSLSSSL